MKSKTKLPFVSIVIVNYNGKTFMKDCFESLRKTNYPKDKYEIIMGDNGSTDDSIEFTKRYYKEIKVLEFKENYGFCKGNNLCVKETKGDYIVFLNNDTIVRKDWLINLVTPVISEKGVISAGCKMLKIYKINGKNIIDFAGGKFTYDMNYYEGVNEEDNEKYDKQKYTGFGCGAGVIVDKKFFIDNGGFDEYYFGGGEEVELGLRAWEQGYKVLYVPSSTIIHRRGETFKGMNYFATAMWTKSIFYYILKNYEVKNIIRYMLESIFFVHLAKIIFFLKRGDFKGAFSVVKGIYWFLRDIIRKGTLKRIKEQRKLIKKYKKLSDNQIRDLGLNTTFMERIKYRMKNSKMVDPIKVDEVMKK